MCGQASVGVRRIVGMTVKVVFSFLARGAGMGEEKGNHSRAIGPSEGR